VIFLGIWLWTAFAFSMQSVCSCCYPKEYQHGDGGKKHETQLSRSHENQQKNSHHQQEKNKCHQEDSDCFCTKCNISDIKETVLNTCLTGEEKKQVLAPSQIIFERKNLLTKGITTYQESILSTKFLSLFLLNSSFLL
jgi:hypothetical protein